MTISILPRALLPQMNHYEYNRLRSRGENSLTPYYTLCDCVNVRMDDLNLYKKYMRASQLVGDMRPLAFTYFSYLYPNLNAVSFCMGSTLPGVIKMTAHVPLYLFQCEAGKTLLLGRPIGACQRYGKPSPSIGAPNLMDHDGGIQYIALRLQHLIDNEYAPCKLRFCDGNLDPCSNSDGWRLLVLGKGPGSRPATYCETDSINFFDSDHMWLSVHKCVIFKYVLNMSRVCVTYRYFCYNTDLNESDTTYCNILLLVCLGNEW